ncbi:aberrant root formation protein 4 isoform X2 [Diospyros lotus]|uniref:aberrant root formation protein 4 isoform X2 n=1 Tax=Diospyros lotus TaxID=55363 RepID=UPI00225513F0|nr:aberrant root formation protein 4 isoform X2 [Diospyros lotus]
MSVESLRLSEASLDEPPSSQPLLLRLHRALISCSTSIEAGDFCQLEKSVAKLVDFLDSVTGAAVSEPDKECFESDGFQVLTELQRYITSPSVDQAVVDALSLELPKAVSRFACLSQRCLEITESVIDRFVESCSPRDMLTILCEALDSPNKMFKAPGYFIPLLSGLSKVFISINRRQFEQVKEAVPVVINVLKTMSLESDEEDTGYEALLHRSIDIAKSIQAVSMKLEDKVKEKLRALLGLYVLQVMAFVSIGIRDKVSGCVNLVLELSRFFSYCNLSYLSLITGCDIDKITSTVVGEDGDDFMGYFPNLKLGASLSVIWGYISNEFSEVVGEDLAAVKAELSGNQVKRWQALGMLRDIFSCVNLPWELKKQATNFLLWIFEGNISHEYDNKDMECSFHMPSLFATLQAVQMVIMYAPDSVIRKYAFDAFRKHRAERAERTPEIGATFCCCFCHYLLAFAFLSSRNQIAILIDCLRGEMHMENCRSISVGNQVIQAQTSASTTFWNAGVLELVELVLRPPKGGPPSLPEYGDAVLSALNLYRFVLITESTGKTNWTGVVSKNNLQKAYNEWLLPLRTLVTGIAAENQDYDQLAEDTVCALNPIELVLFRCLELVEEKLNHAG